MYGADFIHLYLLLTSSDKAEMFPAGTMDGTMPTFGLKTMGRFLYIDWPLQSISWPDQTLTPCAILQDTVVQFIKHD